MASQLRLFAVPMLLVGLSAAFAFAFRGATAEEAPADPWAAVPKAAAHVDHSTFFPKDPKDGPGVTKRCLDCHPKAGQQMLKSAHFRWEGEPVKVPGHEREMAIGKKNVINNFCIGIQGGNWPACTKCHAGYGWKDEGYDFTKAENVDCLVCHDQSGEYAKGLEGQPKDDVDLLAAAKSVGRPSRNNCGSCHFAGGGGDAVKHGDLDGSLLNPRERIDVHMGRHDLQCVDCHQTSHHDIPGRSLSVSVDDRNRVGCADCHQGTVHPDRRLEEHTSAVACQTCHIPSIAVDTATKMRWDWSTAGDHEKEKRVNDKHHYMAIKGTFEYEKDAAPEYTWWNGTGERYLVGDKMDPSRETVIAGPRGAVGEKKAKIWPFKVHRGKQIYDRKHRHFIVPKTFGEGGYWTTFDWASAAENGCRATGLDCSGDYGFAPTSMYWPLSHMVQTKGRALQCGDCHGERGRLDWEALGYAGDPLRHGGRERQGLLR